MSLLGVWFRSFVEPRQSSDHSINQSNNESNNLYEPMLTLPPAYDSIRRSTEPFTHSNHQPNNRSMYQSDYQMNGSFDSQPDDQPMQQSRSFMIVDDEEEDFSLVIEDYQPNNQSIDISEILELGYTERQAMFAVNLFLPINQSVNQSFNQPVDHSSLIHQAISYLIDMDEHPDVLEAQIVQMEVEHAYNESLQSSNQSNNRSSNQSVLGRLFPRLQTISRNISAALSGSPSPTEQSAGNSIYHRVHSPHSPSFQQSVNQSTLQRSVSSPGVMSTVSQPDSVYQSQDESVSQIPTVDESTLSKALPFSQPQIPESFFEPWSCPVCTYINQPADQTSDEEKNGMIDLTDLQDIPLQDLITCSSCESTRELTTDQAAYQSATQQCDICLGTYHSSYFPVNPPCGHRSFCLGCMHDFVRSKIFDLGQILSVDCLEHGCNRPLTLNEIESVLSPYDYSRYLRFKRSAELSLDPRVRYCTNLQCQNVLFGQSMAPRLRCEKCSAETCFNCQMKWHESLTCAQVQHVVNNGGAEGAEADIAFLQYLAQSNNGQTKYRQCPGCRCWLERAAGCAKMTCRCGANFCFVCGSINANCACTPRFHVFYPLHTVLGNWNGSGPE